MKGLKIKPYIPIPFRKENIVVEIYVVDFTDKVGNKAKITKVDYNTNKGKLVESYTLFVKWYK